MDAQNRKPLWYRFGNHMHWVDTEGLWGSEVLPGSVDDMLRFCRAAVWRTNLLGERIEELRVMPVEEPAEAAGCSPGGWNEVMLSFRPREIVTVVADLALRRKQVRDLDARREVWASVHRRSEE